MKISRLVSDLEGLSQAEKEYAALEKEPVELLTLSHTVHDSFEQRLALKNLSCSVTGDVCTVYADAKRIRQILDNLFSNAIKYSHECGEIRISIHDSGENGILEVEDEGIGISQEEIPLIFERFYRTDKSRSRKTGGTGIGLAIVKSLVQAHGGTVKVESEAGQGSRFTVILPKGEDYE